MTLGRASRRVALLALCAVQLAVATACKERSGDAPAPQAEPTTPLLPPTATFAPLDPGGARPEAPSDPFAHNAAPTEVPTRVEVPIGTETITATDPAATTPAPTAPPPDPYDRAIADTKAGAVTCFAGLPPGEYASVLVIVVSSAGRVTRSEVTPGNVEDPRALDCLRTYAASRSFPAASSGRELRIEVRVKG